MNQEPSNTLTKNDKKVVNAWALFDWANSAYALVISTAVFPVYFIASTPDIITLFGIEFTNSSLYTGAITISYLIIACLSPILSGIADSGGRRMFFMKMFTVIGAFACMSLFFFKGADQLWLGTVAFILATIGFAGSIVFYNAYLPEIVSEDQYDTVSAKGFAYGYVGSVILLIIILAMIQKPGWFNMAEGTTLPARLGFLLVGLWWLGFAQISFINLPKDSQKEASSGMLRKGFQEIVEVFGKLKKKRDIKLFLLSFFFYFAGVQTVIYVATIFAQIELNFDAGELIVIVLILQLVAIVGAYFFAYVSKIKGNKASLMAMLFIWISICLAAYFVESKMMFHIIAALVGLVMGGIQSLSRSTYSKMVDDNEGDLTSWFSFYDVVYKVSLVAGSFLFALVDIITQNLRYSVLVLTVFFAIGIWLLSMVDIKSAMSKSTTSH